MGIKPINNCLICNKPTYKKSRRDGKVLCSDQCDFILDNRTKVKFIIDNLRELTSRVCKIEELIANSEEVKVVIK